MRAGRESEGTRVDPAIGGGRKVHEKLCPQTRGRGRTGSSPPRPGAPGVGRGGGGEAGQSAGGRWPGRLVLVSLFFPPLSSTHGVWENSGAGGSQWPPTHPKLASFSERKKNLHLKVPGSVKGWLRFFQCPGLRVNPRVLCVCVCRCDPAVVFS